jgi:hypothetical protein
MRYDKKQLKEPTKFLYGFSGKRIKPVGVITLPVSFGTPKNPRTEYLTFDVVDILYPYNVIFGWGLLNTFEATRHSTYLCFKVPATFGVITIFDSQKEARNIECGFALRHKNVHFLTKDMDQPEQPLPKQEISTEFKKAIKAEGDFTRVALNPRVLDRTVALSYLITTMLTVRLVIIGTIEVIVPFFTLLLFKALALLTLVSYPAVCIFVVDDVAQISIILVSSSATFL